MAAIITSTSTQFALEHRGRWSTEHHPEDPKGHHHHLGEDHADRRLSHHGDGSHHPHHRSSQSDHDLHYGDKGHGERSRLGSHSEHRGEGHHHSDKRHGYGQKRQGSSVEYDGHHHRSSRDEVSFSVLKIIIFFFL